MTVVRGLLPWILAWMLIVESLSLHAALAGCTSSQRRKMDREGLRPSAIDRICGNRDDADDEGDDDEDERGARRRRRMADEDEYWDAEDRSQSSGGGGGGSATFCVTSAGGCPMVIAGQRGGVCTCITPLGPMYGIAR